MTKHQQAKEKAIEQLKITLDKMEGEIIRFHEDEINQLTCEIYAQMFAEFIQPLEYGTPYYHTFFGVWRIDGCDDTWQGSTEQVHELFKNS